MRSAGNFHPEWGYLAPAPSFMRTVRIVLVATAIGATAGAAVVVSLVAHPIKGTADASIAAHTLVTNVEPARLNAVPALAAAPVSGALPVAQAPVMQAPVAQVPAAPAALAVDGSNPPPAPADLAVKEPHQATAQAPVPPVAAGAIEPVPEAASKPVREESPEHAPARKVVARKHRMAGAEPTHRYQPGEDDTRQRWDEQRGFGPLFRLFSFRTNSSYSPN